MLRLYLLLNFSKKFTDSMTANILAGRYQVIKTLGSGGFGQTFQAQDLHLPGQPICVIKQLHPIATDKASLAIAKRLFNQEAEILHKLGYHQQIPCLLAYFEQDGEFYLVEDFIDGQPLDQEITPGKKFQEADVIELLKNVLQVLAFVHQNNVIHRDIKPANLIRRKYSGKIVLIDFGAVKEVRNQIANSVQTTQLTVAVGSPAYMASEQIAGRPQFSSDLYSLGIMSLEALTGLSARQLPRDNYTQEISFAQCQTIASISLSFSSILEKMVRYDFRQRYVNATQALQYLEKFSAIEQSLQNAAQAATALNLPHTNLQNQDTVAIKSENQESTAITTPLDPDFLERCRRELARFIGPFANFIVDDTIAQQPQISSRQLIAILAAEIPNSQQAQEFQNKLS